MSVISYFVPFLFLFASTIRLSKEPLPADAIRFPGGRPVTVALALLGFVTTAVSLILAFVPPGSEPDKLLAVLKLAFLTFVLVAGGATLYAASWRRRSRRDAPD